MFAELKSEVKSLKENKFLKFSGNVFFLFKAIIVLKT